MAAVACVSGLALAGVVSFPVPGGNPHLQEAVASGEGVDLTASAASGGVTIRAKGALADAVQTVVTINLNGVDAIGTRVTFGPTFLRTSTGQSLPLRRSAQDNDDPSIIGMYFDALPVGTAAVGLDISTISLYEESKVPTTPHESEVLPLRGPWHLTFDSGQVTSTGAANGRVSSASAAPMGPGRAVLDSVVASRTGVSIQGHFEGLNETQLQATVLRARLTDANGKEFPLVSGRSGFGEGLAGFEFQYDRVASGTYHFGFTITVPDSPAASSLSATARTALTTAGATPAQWTVEVP